MIWHRCNICYWIQLCWLWPPTESTKPNPKDDRPGPLISHSWRRGEKRGNFVESIWRTETEFSSYLQLWQSNRLSKDQSCWDPELSSYHSYDADHCSPSMVNSKNRCLCNCFFLMEILHQSSSASCCQQLPGRKTQPKTQKSAGNGLTILLLPIMVHL